MNTDTAPSAPAMPRSTPFDPARPDPGPRVAAAFPAGVDDRSDRNNVFGHLVQDDGDIAGLVAYSIYKQHKLDWLRAFEAARGRAPDDNELASYIIGEGTPRRLATYRHLAEATLAGRGPEIDGMPPAAARQPLALRSRFAGRRAGEGFAIGMVALYGLIAVLFVFGFYLAMHFTATTR